MSFAGPAFLVSVGYMDPGNWGTDLDGGARFGYTLLWVIFASNLMAQFLQILCAKLGLVTGQDLAMACRDYYRRPVVIAMWLLCEIAIIACDLAEVVGSAVALNLLFKIPLTLGVLLTGFDVLLLLGFMKFGFRKIEAIICTLIATVFGCFLYDMLLAKPDWGAVAQSTFIPSLPAGAIVVAVGILGATVMPHNLYLHSSIVQTRKHGRDPEAMQSALTFNKVDTIVALSFAFFVNAAILVLAASVFPPGSKVEELQQGHELLKSTLGASSALVFAIALLASGQSSTITGTLAGQIVMEGFMNWKVTPWLRRLITRCLAIVPAIILIQLSGGKDTVGLLVNSQVVLSLQLPFAIFPLVAITSDRARMGSFVNSPVTRWVGYALGGVIAVLNAYLIYAQLGLWWLVGALVVIASFAAAVQASNQNSPSKQ